MTATSKAPKGAPRRERLPAAVSVTEARQRTAQRAAFAASSKAQQVTAAAPSGLGLIREDNLRCQKLDGIGRTTLRRLIAENGFPPAIRLSERILAWDVAEVDRWIASRPRSGAAA